MNVDRNGFAAAVVSEVGSFVEGNFVPLRIHLHGKELHELPANKHLRCSSFAGHVQNVEGLAVDVQFANSESVHMDCFGLHPAPDRPEVRRFLVDK